MYDCCVCACYGSCVFTHLEELVYLCWSQLLLTWRQWSCLIYVWVCMFGRHAHCNQPFGLFTVVSNLSAYKLQAIFPQTYVE